MALFKLFPRMTIFHSFTVCKMGFYEALRTLCNYIQQNCIHRIQWSTSYKQQTTTHRQKKNKSFETVAGRRHTQIGPHRDSPKSVYNNTLASRRQKWEHQQRRRPVNMCRVIPTIDSPSQIKENTPKVWTQDRMGAPFQLF